VVDHPLVDGQGVGDRAGRDQHDSRGDRERRQRGARVRARAAQYQPDGHARGEPCHREAQEGLCGVARERLERQCVGDARAQPELPAPVERVEPADPAGEGQQGEHEAGDDREGSAERPHATSTSSARAACELARRQAAAMTMASAAPCSVVVAAPRPRLSPSSTTPPPIETR
jgi:hypothetical protein